MNIGGGREDDNLAARMSGITVSSSFVSRVSLLRSQFSVESGKGGYFLLDEGHIWHAAVIVLPVDTALLVSLVLR